MKSKRKSELETGVSKPSRAGYWDSGSLIIDGSDARHIVERAIAGGHLRRGLEIYQRDGKPISKRGR